MKAANSIINDVRAFNRFYTVLIGLLDGHLLNSPYSLAEARILYEIQAGPQVSASHIISNLNMDKGYMSRILKRFEKEGLIEKKVTAKDARVSLLELTHKGMDIFNELNEDSNKQIITLLQDLTHFEQSKLVDHMNHIKILLDKRA